jgi:hypothetical protein
VGDFNGDGIPDLAIVNSGNGYSPDGSVTILLGNGDATFRTAGSFPAGTNPGSVAVADFNGDGKDDIVTTNFAYSFGGHYINGQILESDVRVFLSNGDGTFQAAQVFAAGKGCSSVVVADFNGDGIPDLAVGDGGSIFFADDTVSILRGKGDGTFQAPEAYHLGYLPISSVAVGDFNGDGSPDIAVASQYDSSFISVLLGKGDGTFQPPQNYPTSLGGKTMAVADFNRDGHVDLAVASGGGRLSILLGNGDGTLQPAQNYAVAGGGSVVAGDINRDGYPDLAVAGIANPGTVKILLNDANWPP